MTTSRSAEEAHQAERHRRPRGAVHDGLVTAGLELTFGHEQAERLSVQVTAATGASPTGQVAIKAGATRICTITLAKGKGSCTLTASKLAVGTYQLTATYNGDGTHARSTSPKKALTVTK